MLARLREVLGSKDAPLLWSVSAVGAVAGAGGLGLGLLIGPPRLALGAAVAAIFVAAAGSVLPRGAGRVAAAVIAVGAVAFATLAAAVAGEPVPAGLAMAFVAFGSGVLAASGGVSILLGTLLATAYVVPAAIGTGYEQSLGRVAAAAAIGAVWGMVFARVVSRITKDESPAVGREWARTAVGQMRSMAHDLGDPRVRYGLRRGIALGIGMAIYEGTGDRDALWVMLTIFVVLQPERRASWDFALVRTVGTFAGIGLLALLAVPLTNAQLVIAALIILDLGIAWVLRNSAVLTMATTIFAVAVTEVLAPGFTHPATHRLADTLLGAAIAILVGYVLFPDRGREEEEEAEGATGA
ncbi:MAG: FUSC family protein [Solirubrobacterales bacterium]